MIQSGFIAAIDLGTSKITGVEIQKESYELAYKSVKLNNLENQIEIINNDIKEYYKNIETETFDVITCNPPFFKLGEQSHLNESIHKQIARHEIALNLEEIIKISKKLLKNNLTCLLRKVNRSIERRRWCHQDSNRGHTDFQSDALPTELWHQFTNN